MACAAFIEASAMRSGELSAGCTVQDQKGKILTTGNHDPDEVHEEEVEPKVKQLRPRVGDAHDHVVKCAGCKVKHIAVELPKAHERLQRKPPRTPQDHHRSHHQASRSPASSRDRLHAQHKRVVCQVPTIRKRILFPHLPNQGLVRSQVGEVQGVVAFEEDVYAARKDKPHDRDELGGAERGLDALGDEVGGCEEGGAGAEEDAEEVRDGGLVGEVADDCGIERVVGVWWVDELARIVGELVEVGLHGRHRGFG